MRVLKSALKGIGILLAGLLLFSAGCLIYSPAWQAPRAARARIAFEQGVQPGMSEGEVRAIPSELGASSFRSIPKPDREHVVFVNFDTFPGGIAHHLCEVAFSGSRATRIRCGFRG